MFEIPKINEKQVECARWVHARSKGRQQRERAFMMMKAFEAAHRGEKPLIVYGLNGPVMAEYARHRQRMESALRRGKTAPRDCARRKLKREPIN